MSTPKSDYFQHMIPLAEVLVTVETTCNSCGEVYTTPAKHIMLRVHDGRNKSLKEHLTRLDTFEGKITTALPLDTEIVRDTCSACPSCFSERLRISPNTSSPRPTFEQIKAMKEQREALEREKQGKVPASKTAGSAKISSLFTRLNAKIAERKNA